MWLLDLLNAKSEVDRYKSRVLELEDEFRAEMDRNRQREDDLLAQICHLAKAERPTPHRPLQRPTDESADIDIVFDDAKSEREETIERAIQARAREFFDQARAAGVEYDFEVLVEMIRKNPDEYLDN